MDYVETEKGNKLALMRGQNGNSPNMAALVATGTFLCSQVHPRIYQQGSSPHYKGAQGPLSVCTNFDGLKVGRGNSGNGLPPDYQSYQSDSSGKGHPRQCREMHPDREASLFLEERETG